MIETLAGPGAGEVDDLTARDLLALARDRKAAEERAAADLLVVAARWADLHPPESIHSAATFTVPGCEHEEPIAGEGAPLVAEFCLAELGTVLGISTTAAKKLVGHALELRHRLPRLWAQVHGRPGPGVAGPSGRGGHHPHHPVPDAGGRGVRRRPGRRRRRSGRSGAAGPARRRGHQALRPRRASTLPRSGGRLPPRRPAPRHDPRRRRALRRHDAARGRARHRRRPRPRPGARPRRRVAEGTRVRRVARRPPLRRPRRPRTDPDRARPPRRRHREPILEHLPAAREVVLHAHFDASLDGLATVFGPTGRMEEGQRLVLLDQVSDWCADSRTKVTIKPVIDLNADLLDPGVRGPRPDPRAGHPPRPHLRVPVVHPPGPRLRHRPRHPVMTRTPRPRGDRSRARRRPTTSPRCAGSTTASRPTPPGVTG